MTLSVSRYPNGINNSNISGNPLRDNYPSVDPTKLFIAFRDFDEYNSAEWTVTETDSGATEAITDAANGRLLITNTAADNDAVSMQLLGASFVPAVGRTIWAEILFQASEATQIDLLFGLVATDTSPLANANGIYFIKNDGDTNLNFVSNASSVATTESAIATFAADADIKLSFRVTGTSLVEYYVNDLKLGEVTTTIPTVGLRPTFHIQNGDGNARTASIDYILAAQTR